MGHTFLRCNRRQSERTRLVSRGDLTKSSGLKSIDEMLGTIRQATGLVFFGTIVEEKRGNASGEIVFGETNRTGISSMTST